MKERFDPIFCAPCLWVHVIRKRLIHLHFFNFENNKEGIQHAEDELENIFDHLSIKTKVMQDMWKKL